MQLVERFWACITTFLNVVTFSSFNVGPDGGIQKWTLSDHHRFEADGPIFKPPGRLRSGEEANFTCDYSAMKGWVPCSTPQDRTCWLLNTQTGVKLDTTANYEDVTLTPIGTTRQYTLNVSTSTTPINVDGEDFLNAMLFNGNFPGPWIQACWGDTVEITVNVDPSFEMGTSIHWHGIRQWQSMQMDGVPGITQCPIAPGGSFTYKWRAMQYGSAWYHSHYSVQYADGLLGPLTIHGPSTAPYDEAPAEPLFISDWDHRSAFKRSPLFPTVLLGGIGNVTRCQPSVVATQFQEPFTLGFTQGKKYLLRIINTAYNSAFLFSIDNHLLTVVSADFVPITPYTTNSIAVQIGQRYNVIVEANPQNTSETDFWMRTYVLSDCSSNPMTGPEYMNTGIIRYDSSSTADPTSAAWAGLDTTTCRDETSIVPTVQWHPQQPINPQEPLRSVQGGNGGPFGYPWAMYAFETPEEQGNQTFLPLRVDWQNITFLNLDNDGGWPVPWIILPEAYSGDDWIFLVLINPDWMPHPVHLHGHDFAVIAQEGNKPYNQSDIVIKDNPIRRDVVMLPVGGYAVIAFRSDNPGAWLLHCHIASHASGGLDMQILEDQAGADKLWPGGSPPIQDAAKLCIAWNSWCSGKFGTPGCNTTSFQEDSGV